MKKLEEQFLPYQKSMNMKELGFNEECLAIHSFVDGELEFMYVNTFHSNNDVNEKSAAAPLWQQAFQFLIDKYGLRGATEKEKRLENLKVLIKFAKDISCHITNS